MSYIIESYSTDNQSSQVNIVGSIWYGQTFKNINKSKLESCQVQALRFGTPTGNAQIRIYAHNGTFGVNGLPTGVALATSDNIDVSTIPVGFQLTSFVFSGINRINLNSNTPYVFVVVYTGGDSSNKIFCGADITSPTAKGNQVHTTNGGAAWDASTTVALTYYINGSSSSPFPIFYQTIPS